MTVDDRKAFSRSHGERPAGVKAQGLPPVDLQGRLSERTIALDVLRSLKLELLQDAASLAMSWHPTARKAFRRMAEDHERLYGELAAFVRRRGWRREPQAYHHVAAQLVHDVEKRRPFL